LHTYAGGIAMGLLAGLLMFGAVQIAGRVVPKRWRWFDRLASGPKARLLSQSLVSGVVGGVSHILLDSFMHQEMNPLWPVVDGNVLTGTIGLAALHAGLALSAFFGLVLWLLLRNA
jgi:hypothetical protein